MEIKDIISVSMLGVNSLLWFFYSVWLAKKANTNPDGFGAAIGCVIMGVVSIGNFVAAISILQK